MSEWFIYRGVGQPDPARIDALPEPPPWRKFDATTVDYEVPQLDSSTHRRLGERTVPLPVQDPDALELVNAALYLRRPLLVTGEPGRRQVDAGPLRRVRARPRPRPGVADRQPQRTARRPLHLRRHRPPPGRPAARRERRPGHRPVHQARPARHRPARRRQAPGAAHRRARQERHRPAERPAERPGGGPRSPSPSWSASPTATRRSRSSPPTARRVTVTRRPGACHAFPFVIMTSNREREFPAAAAAPLHPARSQGPARRTPRRPRPGPLRAGRRTTPTATSSTSSPSPRRTARCAPPTSCSTRSSSPSTPPATPTDGARRSRNC